MVQLMCESSGPKVTLLLWGYSGSRTSVATQASAAGAATGDATASASVDGTLEERSGGAGEDQEAAHLSGDQLGAQSVSLSPSLPLHQTRDQSPGHHHAMASAGVQALPGAPALPTQALAKSVVGALSEYLTVWTVRHE
jgi:hypothetical protein